MQVISSIAKWGLNIFAGIIIIHLVRAPLRSLFYCLSLYRKYRGDRRDWVQARKRWYIFIHLPNELISSLLTFIYLISLFNWSSSWPILIALSALLFKRIIQDPLYILHTYILNLTLKGKGSFDGQNLHRIFPSAIYMPHLGYSETEIEDALSNLSLSYLNNKDSANLVIYHSDHRDPKLILKSLKTLKYLKEKLGIKGAIFFQRNIEGKERNFLGKPGAYIADYQLLQTSCLHPLTYIEKEWDARLQVKVKLDESGKISEEKFHIPFIPPGKIGDEYEYFILYGPKGRLYLKEEPQLITKDGQLYHVKIEARTFLVSKQDPRIRYILYMGSIYDLDGNLLLRPEEWEMDWMGRITLKSERDKIPSTTYSIFTQKLIYLDGKRFFVDEDLNILDENFNLFLEKGSYELTCTYKLYQRNDDYLKLIREDFKPEGEKIIGQDFRRNPLEPMHAFPEEALREIDGDPYFDYFEKEKIRKLGCWGDIDKYKGFKHGWEGEYLIRDDLIQRRMPLKGGFYLIDKRDVKKDKFFLREGKREIVEKDGVFFGMDEGKELPLIKEDGKPVTEGELENKVLVKAPFINSLKVSDMGYVANEKDGFFLRDGNLYFSSEDGIYKVSNDPLKLDKKLTYIDPNTGELKVKKLIAPPGAYRLEGNHLLLKGRLSSRFKGYWMDKKFKLIDLNTKEVFELEGGFSINEYGIWSDEIIEGKIPLDGLKFEGDYVFEERSIKGGNYKVEGDHVEADGKIYPLGFGLYLNGIPLKLGDQFVRADLSPFIINQMDSDSLFLKDTLKEINSFLTAQLFSSHNYGMVQPEISFANASDSLFARLISWGHEEFKYAERSFFKTYGESNSYGKISKILPLYLWNISFKQAIPAIARTHDHWEAMNLKTYLKTSYQPKRSKLVEDVPSNFYSFLRRKQGWLAGDFLLLELESTLCTLMNLLRWLFALLKGDVRGRRFWPLYLKEKKREMREKRQYYSALGLQRIETLKRTTLSTTYLMSWLILSGWLALLLPGSLIPRSTFLPWLFFILFICLIAFLPKFLFPLINTLIRRKDYVETPLLFLITSSSILAVKYLLDSHPISLKYFAFIGYSYLTCRGIFLPLLFMAFGKRRRLIVRIVSLTLFISSILALLNWYDSLLILANDENLSWISLLFMRYLPLIFAYLIPLWTLYQLLPLGRKICSTFKEGFKELTITTSTLLMLLVYEPLHILKLIYTFTRKPLSKVEWLPQSYWDKIAEGINSTLRAYRYLYLPPLFCLVLILIPIKFGLLPSNILYYGWPIFIWSWLLGPLWAYWSGKHRRNLEKVSPRILILRKILDNFDEGWKLSKDFNLPFLIDEEEEIKLRLYLLTEEASKGLIKDAKFKTLVEKAVQRNQDPRVYSWWDLPEFSRVRIIKKFRKGLDEDILKEINFHNALLFHMLKKGWAEVEWKDLRGKHREKVIEGIKRRYGI